MSSQRGPLRYVEHCLSCGGFEWGCLTCGAAVGIEEIARAGRGAEKLFKETRVLMPRELSAMLSACISSGPPQGTRDAAIVAVLCQARLQAAELVALELDDWNGYRRALTVKGRPLSPQRNVVLDAAVSGAIGRWISVRGPQPGMLFVDVHGRGGIAGGRGITRNAVYEVLRKRSTQAGIERVRVQDLHGASLRPLIAESVGGSASPKRRVRGAIARGASKLPKGPDERRAELVEAARKLGSLRPVGREGPVPLDDLTTMDLERLRKRVSGILLRRELEDLEGGRGLTGRQPSHRTRRRVAQAVADGIPKMEISRLLGMSRKSINRCVDEYRNYDGRQKKSHFDGVPKIGPKEKRILLADLEARPLASLRQRQKHMAEVGGLEVAYQTLLIYIRRMGYGYVGGQWVLVSAHDPTTPSCRFCRSPHTTCAYGPKVQNKSRCRKAVSQRRKITSPFTHQGMTGASAPVSENDDSRKLKPSFGGPGPFVTR